MENVKTNTYSKRFIAATKEYCTLYRCIPSPYLRKTIRVENKVEWARFSICGLGFYRFWLNGKEVTKGFLSPYISNSDDVLDYDEYDLSALLRQGKNVLAFQLGNGMQNAFSGYVWSFEQAPFRSAPKMACQLTMKYVDGTTAVYEADESFVCRSSPLLLDDLRMGEIYDANDEINGWNEVEFDDSAWENAIPASTPKGKAVRCAAKPITVREELKPISIFEDKWVPGGTRRLFDGEWFLGGTGTHHYGYTYDFGVNTSGIVKLKIKGKKGQKVVLTFGEMLYNGSFFTDNITFIRPDFANYHDYVQQITYTCKGNGVEEYEPSFTYHGFRYVFVEGITEEQATEDLLTYKVMNTDLREKGNFACSCEKLNKLQAMTRNATLSNFWHFPNDCPHREKNGWTADAALSAEHTLLNLDAGANYYEWMRHVRAAMREDGALPGIVPTCGWGFTWGNGPAWDQALIEVPYMVYRYTGDKKIVEENMDAMMRYVRYLDTRKDERGLLAIGLGDWCAPYGIRSPLVFTDSVTAMVICRKAALLARVCNRTGDADYCAAFAEKLKENIRTHLIDLNTYLAEGNTQTSQALAIYYGIFEESEKEQAFAVLLSLIERENKHLDTGVIGARIIFHLLADFGYADLAYEMLVEPTPPSYGYWLEQGYTSLAEDFFTDEEQINSKNHHFWGDISAFFIKDICGIHYNPNLDDLEYVEVKPQFISNLTHAKAYHDSPKGKIETEWYREGDGVILTLNLPQTMKYSVQIPQGYRAESSQTVGNQITVTVKKG